MPSAIISLLSRNTHRATYKQSEVPWTGATTPEQYVDKTSSAYLRRIPPNLTSTAAPCGCVTAIPLPHTAQLRALGNGVIPQQAAYAISLLLDDLAFVLRSDSAYSYSSDDAAA
ncbi:hypothetical protein [Lentzea sp. NPDC059081]|uniref:hypothetical protein n=1 Tax=Lentzea sp. NPDC059081 TaxID=3346719 RepID=UPI00368D4334